MALKLHADTEYLRHPVSSKCKARGNVPTYLCSRCLALSEARGIYLK